jgi:hypothetical protein
MYQMKTIKVFEFCVIMKLIDTLGLHTLTSNNSSISYNYQRCDESAVYDVYPVNASYKNVNLMHVPDTSRLKMLTLTRNDMSYSM